MAESLGEAVLTLTTDSTGLDNGIDAAQDKATNLGASFIAAGAAITAIGVPFAMAAEAAVAAGDDYLALSEKVGISVERLSGWKLGLEQSNTSLGALEVGLKTFSKEASGPLDEALLEMADRFAAMPDGAEKAQLAVDRFGRSGLDLIPFLNQGSKGILKMEKDSAALGVTMSTKTAKAADNLNDSILKVSAALQGIVTRMASSGLLDKLADFANRIADVISQFTEAHPQFTQFVTIAGLMAAAIGPILVAVGALTLAIGALSTPLLIVFGAAGAIAVAIAAIVSFTKENDKLRTALVQIWEQIKSLFLSAFNVLAGALKTFAGAFTGDWKLMAEGIKQIWTGLWEAIKTIILAPLKSIRDSITGFTSGVTGAFKGMYDTIVGKSIVPDLIDGIEREFGNLDEVMKDPAKAATDGVVGAFSNMFGGIIDGFTKNIPIVGGLVGDLLNKLADMGLDKLLGVLGLPGIGGGAAGSIPSGTGGIPGIPGVGGAGGAASGIGGAFAGIGSSVIGGAISGIGSFLGSMRLEGTMNAVEANTRFTYIELKDTMEQILWPMHGFISFLADQSTVFVNQLDAIHSQVYPLNDRGLETVSAIDRAADAIIAVINARPPLVINVSPSTTVRELLEQLQREVEFGSSRLPASAVLR